jgi:catechol 2,3-dioxygenase
MNQFHLPDDTHIGHAHLQVADVERSLHFYVDLMGFKQVNRNNGTAVLSASGSLPAHLILSEYPGARPKPRQSTGLFHVAIRLPNRHELARVFFHLVGNGWPFGGFSDHKVSEALYLSDPDGNGLELYRDRPRDQWPMSGGQVEMTSDPLDVDALLALAENDGIPWTGIAPGTDIGHVHLHVANLHEAERFYCNLLGLDVMQRSYAGALFVSAGGYHHHIGLNIWAGEGAPPPPPDAVGLRSFSLQIPDAQAWQTVVSRIEAAGLPIERKSPNSLLIRDPSGNAVELMTRDLG